MKTTFTKTELNELLSIATAEIKELKADNSILKRENKRMHEERDGLFDDIRRLNKENKMRFTVMQKQFDELQSSENIDSIIWFGLNYPPNFIRECWSDDPCLANHLNDKFAMCHEGTDEMKGWVKTRLSYGVFTRFLTMLDDGNRDKLYQYILDTYSRKTGFKVRHTEEA